MIGELVSMGVCKQTQPLTISLSMVLRSLLHGEPHAHCFPLNPLRWQLKPHPYLRGMPPDCHHKAHMH